MSKQINPVKWDEIMKKYNNHKGTIREFCKNNNITERQFYRYRKKHKSLDKPTLHPIILNQVNNEESKEYPSKTHNHNIIIEIGKSKINIPADNTVIISDIVKELLKSC